jgi:hypothetical protein
MTVEVLVIHSLSNPTLIAICWFSHIRCTSSEPRKGSYTVIGLGDRIKLSNTLLSTVSDITFVLRLFWNCLVRIFPGEPLLAIE